MGSSCTLAGAKCWRPPKQLSHCLTRRSVHAWDVLAEYGNMSSPTALFVLQRTLSAGASGLHLLAAFGPGFTVSFALLDL